MNEIECSYFWEEIEVSIKVGDIVKFPDGNDYECIAVSN